MMEKSRVLYGSAKAFEGKFEMTVSLAPMYQGHERHNTFVGGASIYIMKGHDKAEIEGAKAFLDFPAPSRAADGLYRGHRLRARHQ